MPTEQQARGTRGERLVAKVVRCPGCKDGRLRALPPNFKCADVICDFCGYLAQVKTKKVARIPTDCPRLFLGAAWGSQHERMTAGIYFSLFLVLESPTKEAAIFFLPRDLQTSEMFVPRNPLASTARRAGWTGFMIDLTRAVSMPVRIQSGGRDVFRTN